MRSCERQGHCLHKPHSFTAHCCCFSPPPHTHTLWCRDILVPSNSSFPAESCHNTTAQLCGERGKRGKEKWHTVMRFPESEASFQLLHNEDTHRKLPPQQTTLQIPLLDFFFFSCFICEMPWEYHEPCFN